MEGDHESIHAEYDEPLAATIEAWLDPAIEQDADALATFLQEAASLGPIWASFASGEPQVSGRCVSYTFAPQHVPSGLFAVRDWLRSQPAVRLVEVERFYPPVT